MRLFPLILLLLPPLATAAGWERKQDARLVSQQGAYSFELATADRRVAKILNAIKGAAGCGACQDVLRILKGLAHLGDRVFVGAVTKVCIQNGKIDSDVCKGVIREEGPIIAHSLRHLDSVKSNTAKLLCVGLMGLCSYPDVTPWHISFPSPKPETARPRPSGEKPIRIVHYSDTHVDPQYTPGSNWNCTKPICCRPYTEQDAPGNTSFPAGPRGDHKCDTPVNLEESMHAAIRELVPDAAFTLFTGDIVEHAIWNTSEAENSNSINAAYARMGGSTVPRGAEALVYGAAGNHESSPTNAYQQPDQGNSTQWLYDLLGRNWERWVGTSAAEQIRKIGAYSAKYPNGNLRIISLNTNMYYIYNFWLYQDPMMVDPGFQWKWLVSELDAAEKAGERVYIIGHMAMGLWDAFHDGSNYFDQIVNRYSATIAAMFFGHTHRDQFQISYSNYTNRSHDNAVAVSYLAPSLVPTSGHPSFRVYSIDPVTFGVLDSITYYADMADPAFQTTGPVWKPYYSAKAAYGPFVDPPLSAGDGDTAAELTPAFWHNVTAAMERDPTVFAAFWSRKSRGWNVPECNSTACRETEICGLRGARAQDNCFRPKVGVHFQGRKVRRGVDEEEALDGEDEGGNVDMEDECGVTAAIETLGMLYRRDALEVLMQEWDQARGGVDGDEGEDEDAE